MAAGYHCDIPGRSGNRCFAVRIIFCNRVKRSNAMRENDVVIGVAIGIAISALLVVGLVWVVCSNDEMVEALR